MADEVIACPKCQRKSRADRAQCLYCGAELPKRSTFGV